MNRPMADAGCTAVYLQDPGRWKVDSVALRHSSGVGTPEQRVDGPNENSGNGLSSNSASGTPIDEWGMGGIVL